MNKLTELEARIAEAREQSEDLSIALKNVRGPAQKYEPDFGALNFLKAELARIEDEAERKELLFKAEASIAQSESAIAQMEAELAELRQRVNAAKSKIEKAIARYNTACKKFGAEMLELQKAAAEARSDLAINGCMEPIQGVDHLAMLPQAEQLSDGSILIRMSPSGAARNERGLSILGVAKPWYENF